jgi:hypothetical protein
MTLIGAILVEIKIIEILYERSLGEGDRQALKPGNAAAFVCQLCITSESRHDNVYEAIADEPARRGIQDPASIPNAKVSLSGVVAC